MRHPEPDLGERESAAPENGELWADIQPESSRRILLAALEAFSSQGYHASTTRGIAQRVGMSPAALYVHYASKSELLYEMSRIGHTAVLRDVRASAAELTVPTERLPAMVAAFVSWHAVNHDLARVINYELEELTSERLGELQALQKDLEELFRAELQRGVDAGDFAVTDPQATVWALLSLGIDVARWWPRDRVGPDALGDAYAGIALRIVGAAL